MHAAMAEPAPNATIKKPIPIVVPSAKSNRVRVVPRRARARRFTEDNDRCPVQLRVRRTAGQPFAARVSWEKYPRDRGLALLRGERGGAEVHAETGAPDCHRAIFPQVGARRQLVI